MPLISQYSSTNRLRLVLQGPSGVGKTTIAAQFPGAWINDLDVNLGGTISFLKEHKLSMPVGYDSISTDDSGAPVHPLQQFLRLDAKLQEQQKNSSIETIVLDSGTNLADILMYEVCRQQGKATPSAFKDGRQFWGFFAPFCRNFFSVLAQFRKHIVLTAHEKTQTLESGAVVYPIKVAWPGQVGANIGAFFNCVWRAEVEKIPDGSNKMKYLWRIRTKPDGMYELKDTLGLPALFEFSWDTIQAALDKAKL